MLSNIRILLYLYINIYIHGFIPRYLGLLRYIDIVLKHWIIMENPEQTWHLPHFSKRLKPPRGRCMAGTVVIESWGGSSLSPEMVMDGPKVRWENDKRYLGEFL